MISVNLINQTQQQTPTEQDFQSWVTAALQPEFSDAEIAIVIIDSNESARLNKTYRQKSGPTNVLSFGYKKNPVEGDLIFCASVIEAESTNQAKTLAAHYAHLTIHGSLHLLGYNHRSDHDANVMEAKEIETLQQLGFANPYV